jgi:hypothetical protein
MPVKIRSAREGFRRCGIAHSQKPVIHPDDRFTKNDIEIMQAEPVLHVEIIPAETPEPKKKVGRVSEA